jgi:Putative DNA-binding domain
MPELSRFQQAFGARIGKPVAGAMAIYRNTVLSGAVDALSANYPVVAALVGTSMFEAMAVDFATAIPPDSPVLATYGRGLADWIEEQDWAGELPYLSEIARLERLYIEALFAADAEPLTFAMLQGIDPAGWTDLRLKLHPAARFGWSTCPAMSLWLGHQGDTPAELPPEWKAEGGLFARPRHRVTPILLDAPAHRFLFGIRLGESAGTAATRTAALYPHADMGALLTVLVEAGVFAAAVRN